MNGCIESCGWNIADRTDVCSWAFIAKRFGCAMKKFKSLEEVVFVGWTTLDVVSKDANGSKVSDDVAGQADGWIL